MWYLCQYKLTNFVDVLARDGGHPVTILAQGNKDLISVTSSKGRNDFWGDLTNVWNVRNGQLKYKYQLLCSYTKSMFRGNIWNV